MIHSWITLVPLDWLMARHTFGAVHSIAYCRAYVLSIGDDLSPFSLFCHGRALSLNFIPYNSGKNSFFDWSILNTFKIMSRYVLIWKTYQAYWSTSIDLDAQYVSSFTEVILWKTPFKHSFMLCRIILHYFRSTICHSHILIRNVVELPLTFL